MEDKEPIESLNTVDLYFDRENPRLAEYGISKTVSDKKILSILWDTMDIKELLQSIQASGYFPHEPLIVAVENGKQVVIEGNRRLAAVKLLLQPALGERGWDIPRLTKAALKELETLPAIISNRKSSWRYLGFKHVNGPAKWSSYAKAKYIADIHREYKVPLAKIADQIGDRHKTVQRLYRGLMAIEQAEAEGVYDRDDRFYKNFYFSHLYTGLDLDGISKFLSLKSTNTPILVPKSSIKRLGEVCVWLYGSKKENKPPVIKSQNPDLRRLSDALKSREAIAALRKGTGLSIAYELSRSSADVFEEALMGAKRELQKALGYLTTGYDDSQALLDAARDITEIANDVYEGMLRRGEKAYRKEQLSAKKSD